MARVSVVIPTYARVEELGQALRSVLEQTFADLEVIVVSDGPEEREALEQRYGKIDPRVRLVHNQSNLGAPASRNRGMQLATGELIALLDDDDRFYPTKLEKQVALLDSNPALGFVSCGYHDEWLKEDRMPRVRGRVDKDLLTTFSNVETSTILMRAEVVRRVGDIDTSLPSEQNHDFFYRMAKEAEFDFVPEVLVFKSAPPVQISRSPRKKIVGYVRFHRKHKKEISQLGPKGALLVWSKFVATLGLFLLFSSNEKLIDVLYHALSGK